MLKKIKMSLLALCVLTLTSTGLFAATNVTDTVEQKNIKLIKVVPDGNYNKGFKYYTKYIKRTLRIKAPDLVKKYLKAETKDVLISKYFINNGKPFITTLDKIAKEKLSDKKYKEFKKKEKKLEKIKVLKNIKSFLIGIINGKIPAGCS